jgi:predicted metal-binding membrane protein
MGLSAGLMPSRHLGRVLGRQLVWGLFYASILAAWGLLFAMQPGLDLPDGWQDLGADYLTSLCRSTAGTAGYAPVLAMWALMALAMMAPTSIPALKTYTDLGHAGAASASGLAALIGGYLLVWLGFSAFGAAAQVFLSGFGLIDPQGRSTAAVLNAALLATAGAYQFSRLKQACLNSCQSPMMFFMAHWRPGAAGAFHMGLRLGAVCLGCCWALMLLAFVAGTMNLAFMGLAMVLMALEKMPVVGRTLTVPVGIALLAGAALTVFFTLPIMN